MAQLTPPLLLALDELIWQIETGFSVRDATVHYLRGTPDSVHLIIQRWWISREKSEFAKTLKTRSHLLEALIDLLQRGINGQPILAHLKSLRAEVHQHTEHHLELHLQKLPFKMLFPLLFLQFPALMTVLLGPIFRQMLNHFGGV